MTLGRDVSALDYIGLLDRRRAWILEAEEVMQGFDAMLSPTVPICAPELAPLLASDEAFFKVNRLLLRNPSAINYLDGCAFSLPCQPENALPVGLMVSGLRGQDSQLASVAMALEALLA
jgi:aspartyl-tRNA(Asn)/glutamyl-tRNA(Gln) amidotransferase subunit A